MSQVFIMCASQLLKINRKTKNKIIEDMVSIEPWATRMQSQCSTIESIAVWKTGIKLLFILHALHAL